MLVLCHPRRAAGLHDAGVFIVGEETIHVARDNGEVPMMQPHQGIVLIDIVLMARHGGIRHRLMREILINRDIVPPLYGPGIFILMCPRGQDMGNACSCHRLSSLALQVIAAILLLGIIKLVEGCPLIVVCPQLLRIGLKPSIEDVLSVIRFK